MSALTTHRHAIVQKRSCATDDPRRRSPWPSTATGPTWPADEYMAWSGGLPDKGTALRLLAAGAEVEDDQEVDR